MHLTLWQILFLALLQGVTELFPISSVGHMVIFPGLLGWGNIETNDHFIPFLVALHLGTMIALLIYFWRDWLHVICALGSSIKTGEVRQGSPEWESWLIILACVPMGILGLLLQRPLQQLFASPLLASGFLLINGSCLFLGEGFRRRAACQRGECSLKGQEASFRPLAALSWKEALLVGFAQSLSLIPGFSRSGMIMVAGLGLGLRHEDAARYAFLLMTPIIAAAAFVELPSLFGEAASTLGLIGLGMVITGIAAYLSTKFLVKYFETGRLTPFAYYCWGAGLLLLGVFVLLPQLGR